MRVIGTFFNYQYNIEETIILVAPSLDAVKKYMDSELINFKKFYEDIPYEEWKKTHEDGTMIDFYNTFEYYSYNKNTRYRFIVDFDESNFNLSEAIELNSNGGRV